MKFLFITFIYSIVGIIFYHVNFNIYVKETRNHLKRSFSKEILNSDYYELSDQLSRHLGIIKWKCLTGVLKGERIIELRSYECKHSFLYRNLEIKIDENENFKLNLLISLPDLISRLTALTFLILLTTTLLFYYYLNKLNAKLLLAKEEKVTAIKKLSYKVAHDIRSPLQILDMLKDEAFEDKEITNEAINRIQDISNELLNERKEELHQTNLDDVFRTIKNEQSRLNKMDIAFPELENLQVCADKTQLIAILSNLITNSFEAQATKLEITTKKLKNQVTLTLTDNGKGIPQHIKPKLFNTEVTHGKEKGNGIGLYQAHQYLQKWGGDIQLKESSSQGTIFEITLKLS